MWQGLSGVAHEPWGSHWSLPPLPCILLGSHMHPSFSKVKWGDSSAWGVVQTFLHRKAVAERRACLAPASIRRDEAPLVSTPTALTPPHPGDQQKPQVGAAKACPWTPGARWTPPTPPVPTPPVRSPSSEAPPVWKGLRTPAPPC